VTLPFWKVETWFSARGCIQNAVRILREAKISADEVFAEAGAIADLPISFWLGRSLALPLFAHRLKSVAELRRSLLKQANLKSQKPFIIRYSLFATRCRFGL